MSDKRRVMYDTSPVTDIWPPIGETSTGVTAQVEVHLFAAARSAAQADLLMVEAGTLAQVLASCERQASGLADVLPRCSYLINGLAVTDEAARLLPGDRLDVLPPFAGG